MTDTFFFKSEDFCFPVENDLDGKVSQESVHSVVFTAPTPAMGL